MFGRVLECGEGIGSTGGSVDGEDHALLAVYGRALLLAVDPDGECVINGDIESGESGCIGGDGVAVLKP